MLSRFIQIFVATVIFKVKIGGVDPVAKLLWLGLGLVFLLLGTETNAQDKFVPSTASKAAQDLIKTLTPGSEPGIRFEDAKEVWQKAWEDNEKSWDHAATEAKKLYPAKIAKVSIDGAEHLLITPDSYDPINDKRIIIYVHGGAHTFFSPESTLVASLPGAHFSRTKLIAVRYPLAWQKPHPASRDRVVAVYKEMLKTHSPQHIAMYGDSAGGGTLMSAVLKIRDDGLPMPAVLGLISPWADITKTGDSYTLNEGADIILHYEGNLVDSARTYARGQDLKHPSISPLYADFGKGFPPAYISSGTRDLLLSIAVQLQRKLLDAGIENQLIVYEGMWHVFQELPDPTIPEAKTAWRDMAVFFERHWAR